MDDDVGDGQALCAADLGGRSRRRASASSMPRWSTRRRRATSSGQSTTMTPATPRSPVSTSSGTSSTTTWSVARSLGQPALDGGLHRRVHDGVQVGQGVGVVEHQAGECGPVERAVGLPLHPGRIARPRRRTGARRARPPAGPGSRRRPPRLPARPAWRPPRTFPTRYLRSGRPQARPVDRIIGPSAPTPCFSPLSPTKRLRRRAAANRRARRAAWTQPVGDWPAYSPGRSQRLAAASSPPSRRSGGPAA